MKLRLLMFLCLVFFVGIKTVCMEVDILDIKYQEFVAVQDIIKKTREIIDKLNRNVHGRVCYVTFEKKYLSDLGENRTRRGVFLVFDINTGRIDSLYTRWGKCNFVKNVEYYTPKQFFNDTGDLSEDDLYSSEEEITFPSEEDDWWWKGKCMKKAYCEQCYWAKYRRSLAGAGIEVNKKSEDVTIKEGKKLYGLTKVGEKKLLEAEFYKKDEKDKYKNDNKVFKKWNKFDYRHCKESWIKLTT